MPADGYSPSANPNVCPSCTKLLNSLEIERELEEQPVALPASENIERIVPHSASMYGGTFVW
jgi:hypothetical protein